METVWLKLVLEENCKTIGNFNETRLVDSKYYIPIVLDELGFIINKSK
jgi:hypothetical protein